MPSSPTCPRRTGTGRRPHPGWDVATQIAHLAWTDEAAHVAATDKSSWDSLVVEALADPGHTVDRAALTGGVAAPSVILGRWRAARARLAVTLRTYPAGQKMPWYGPPMSATSMATARFMETWAHSLDVHDALGVAPEVSDRVRPVAHLGVRTRDFAFSRERAGRADRGVPGGAHRAVGRPVGLGSRGGRADGDRPGVRLLPAGHPARPPRRHLAGRRRTRRGAWLGIAQCFAGLPGRARADRDDDGSGSATAPASTATGSRPCGRCSRVGRSTCSPVTTWPS